MISKTRWPAIYSSDKIWDSDKRVNILVGVSGYFFGGQSTAFLPRITDYVIANVTSMAPEKRE